MKKVTPRKVTARKVETRKAAARRAPTGITPTEEAPPRKVLSIVETSNLLGLTVAALRQMIWRKRFPHLVIGGRVVVDPAELDRFLTLSRRITAEQAAESMQGKGVAA